MTYGLIVLIIGASGCIKRKDGRSVTAMRGRSIEQVFDSHRNELLSTPGVKGIGIVKLGEAPAIMVIVDKITPDIQKQIPPQLDGYAVMIEEAARFKAFNP